MKKLIFIICSMLIAFASNAQIISTVAGNGTQGYSGDGSTAISAKLNHPSGVAFDASGNIYIADLSNHRIRKVMVNSGIITTVAGIGTAGYSGDGSAATYAQLNYPEGVSLDASGNIYIAELYNHCIRKVTASTGIISTVAGNGTAGYSGDGGAATLAKLNGPWSVTLDASGNIFIVEGGRIRKVTASTGMISTVAGNGTFGYSGDGSVATSAQLNGPTGVSLDASGNIYITDEGNNCIRKITVSTGIISTVVGNGTQGYSGDGSVATSAQLNLPFGGAAIDFSGNIYIADQLNHRIRKVTSSTGIITTFAGTGTAGYSGDGSAATSAQLNLPTGVSLDASGNIYIADNQNQRIRKVTMPPTITSFTPTSGANGATVTITGTNLTGTSAVSIGGTSASSVTVNSDTQITVVVGSGTTGTISLTTPGGTATSSGTFTFIPAPTITSFTPTTGATGATVTITGTNLTGTTAVNIGGTAASSFTVNSDTQVTATIGTGATGTISITTPGGTAVSLGTFTFIPVPTISSFTPTTAASGATVTITGTNLTGTSAVNIGGTSAGSVTVVNATTVTAVVTTGTTGTISLTSPGGTAVSSGTFTFINSGGGVNYTITFTGSGDSNTVGDVVVQNLTQGTSVTIPAGNVLHLYDVSTQINQPATSKEGITIYQNVQQGNSIVSFFSKQTGSTQVNAFSVDGRKIVGINQNLQVGENSFQLTLAKGVYVIQVVGTGYGYTAKLLNPTNSQRNNEITYIGAEKQTGSSPQKTKSEVAGITSMLYTAGDQLLYTAVSGNYSTVVTDVPTETKTTNFNFVACQDADLNNYKTVTIGSQTWMSENLKTTHYRNGENVPNLTDNFAWATSFSGAWCDNGNNPVIGAIFGHFYNYASVVDPRNIAPVGWHVATDAEWTTLSTYLGGVTIAGGKLKETGTIDWLNPNTGATNESGFTALAAGGRSYDGTFGPAGYGGGWWSSTPVDMTTAWGWKVVFNDASIAKYPAPISIGGSVRCVKDANVIQITIPTLTTTDVTIQSSNTASGGGNISSDGGAAVTERGICWSTITAPDITLATKTSDGTGIGAFSSAMTGLNAGTTYYVRAYATNSVGTAYGNELSFTTTAPQITDADGNVYHSVTIGTQTWMVENLKTTKYRNGEAIGTTTPATQDISSESTPKYQWAYNGDENLAAKYGRLYTWYAVADSRNIAPTGWHVASDAEWTTLENYLIANGYNYDGTTTGNKIAKSLAATTDWYSNTDIGTIGNDLTKNNTSGFTALPGGNRVTSGSFVLVRNSGLWWSSTELGATFAQGWALYYNEGGLASGISSESYGNSVRCVRDY